MHGQRDCICFRHCTGRHQLTQPLGVIVVLQAMSYDQAGRSRRVVRLQLVSPVSAAMEKLLALKEIMLGTEHGGDADLEGSQKADSLPSNGGSRKGSSKGGSDEGAQLAAEHSGVNESEPTAHPAGKKRVERGSSNPAPFIRGLQRPAMQSGVTRWSVPGLSSAAVD